MIIGNKHRAEGSAQTALTRRRASSVDWLYRPDNHGRDSAARQYFGYRTDKRARLLRPDNPIKLDLKQDDLVNIINIDGAASLFLVTFDERGDPDFAAISPDAVHSVTLDKTTPGISALFNWFRQNGGLMDHYHQSLEALRIFNESTPAGEPFTLRASADVTLWLLVDTGQGAPIEKLFYGGMGGAFSVDHTRHGTPANPLPDPLGEIREEFTIAAGTARAYELHKGETVQVIDVEGQQCSDFMAMNARSLNDGIERYIDSTTTRSMIRGAYPIPGLFDKFYDQDMRPLLMLKQDTVGRHDTFALACTARGYEERGFFGHLNCSDNISHAYTPYGIEQRSAWPAINFFFNSWIDHRDNQIQSDEAWSRPGDYVAMQAMTDLVAVSTACPDDVDPINGWNPTDVHVRIYRNTTRIQHAVAHRVTPQSEAVLTQHSAFHARTSTLTRQFVVARDVWLPQSYEATRSAEEYHACRTAVTVQDMSSLLKFDVLGPDAERLLQIALTRDITKLSVNRGVYALMCDETGSVIDDGTLFRLSSDTFRWCCGSEDSGLQLKALAQAAGLNVWIKSLFASLANLAVQGPGSRELMQRICFTQPTTTSVEQLRWFGSTVARVHDREGDPFQLTRTGFTGELGYEIFCHPDSAIRIWDALMSEGADLGITPMGLEALEVIRIEAGLMSAGAEFEPGVDAYESGLGFAVDLNKPDFTGRAALARNGSQQRRILKGLRFASHEAPTPGDPVFVGRRQVGVITSATVSPALDCAIAMARLAVEHADNDNALDVGKLDGHGKRLGAVCCDIPFVDPTRSRARA